MKAICLLTILLPLHASAGKKLKVLFIGNSYTYTNNLPQIIASIASSLGDTIVFDSYAPGGYRFADHASDAACAQKIRSADWDCVVLQEQSLMPAVATGSFFTQSYHWAYALDTLIANALPCAEKMFYMTWGRKNGDSNMAIIQGIPELSTYHGMDSLIRIRYQSYADTSLPPAMGYPLVPGSWFSPIRPSQVAPAGAVWRHIRQHFPGIELYQTDGSHPSQAGSFAAACAFYAALFRRDPALSNYNYVLSATDAANIKQAAKLVVYDSLLKWYIGQHDLRADFTPSYAGGNLVIFLGNASPYNANYNWSFGDGTTGTGSSNFHHYPGPGNYSVRLIVTKGNCADTTYGSVTIFPVDVDDPAPEQRIASIYPNPASGILKIIPKAATTDYSVKIQNAVGMVMYEKTGKSEQGLEIDISAYATGMYTATFFAKGLPKQTIKFLKQ